MTDKPAKPISSSVEEPPVVDPPQDRIDQFRLHLLNEVHAQIMVVIFLVSAFMVVGYFNITLITVLEASQWFALLGASGFVLLFITRKKFQLSLLDGLFYNVFGIAPLGLGLMLLINAQCSDSYTETYHVVDYQEGGSGFTYHLENDSYSDFWHIRNLDRDEANNRFGKLKFTFCDGIFGYQVMKHREMVP